MHALFMQIAIIFVRPMMLVYYAYKTAIAEKVKSIALAIHCSEQSL